MFTKSRTIDFTQGNIVKNIVIFSIPIIIGELLQNLYNTADSLVVGNFIGDTALAAVTVSMYVSNMIIGFFNGMSVGSNVVVARAFGVGNKEQTNKNIRVAYTFSVSLGIILSVIGILITPWLLKIAGAHADYYGEALTYLRIYLAGIMFTVIYNSGAGIVRAVGDSTSPFIILFITCILNIILDLLFVAVFKFGIAGAAFATVFSQFLSVVLITRTIAKKSSSHCIDFKEMMNEGKEIVKNVANIGTAAGMQSALVGFSNIFVIRYINMFETAAVAGIGIAQRLDKFVVLPVKSFGLTVTTYVSQNLGAKSYGRIKEGASKTMRLSLFTTITISIMVFFLAHQVSGLFSNQEDVIKYSVDMMHIFVPFIFFMAIREVLLGILRGYGYARMPMVLSLIGMVVVRQIYLMITMNIEHNIMYIYTCYPIAWAATALLLSIYYFHKKKNLKGLE